MPNRKDYIKIGNYRLDIDYYYINKDNRLCAVGKDEEPKDITRNKPDLDLPDDIPETIVDTVNKFITVRKQQYPNIPSVKNANFAASMKEVYKLLKRGYKEDLVCGAIEVALYNDFWKKNLLVLTQLNSKCKSGLTKFDHLLILLKRPEKIDDYEEL